MGGGDQGGGGKVALGGGEPLLLGATAGAKHKELSRGQKNKTRTTHGENTRKRPATGKINEESRLLVNK